MLQSQNSSKEMLPLPSASIFLKSPHGSFKTPTHFSSISLAWTNSLISNMPSPEVSRILKAWKYSYLYLSAIRNIRNSIRSTYLSFIEAFFFFPDFLPWHGKKSFAKLNAFWINLCLFSFSIMAGWSLKKLKIPDLVSPRESRPFPLSSMWSQSSSLIYF